MTEKKEGNNKAMRDALVAINSIDTRGLKRLLCELVEADIFDGGQINKTIFAVEMAKYALSAPPRQCDVGTAEEQRERFGRFCGHYRVRRCKDCPLLAKGPCEFEWAQMPYGDGL